MCPCASISPPLVFVLAAVACAGTQEQRAFPRDEPLIVQADTRVPAGSYVHPATGTDGLGGAIVLRGLEGVTLDLTDVTLRGAPPGDAADDAVGGALDGFTGHGIVIEDCSDVTVRGGVLGGYKGCVVVRRSQDVVLEGMRFERWFGQRLRSNIAAEDPGDWLWPHDNDDDEWLTKYGAAISFEDCRSVTVRDCSGRKGQNGILLTRTDDSRLYDNDFSFLSGWGIALYRASRNTISHNITDYCVRGYSHGVYSRGQDSAGILMFERCNDNVVAFNSATHSGDGVFLFAGQDLVEGRAVERGEDPATVTGSDGNLFYGNDLRYSPANALEATFSNRNLVVRNDLSGCAQHGVWGGYSSEMLILGNVIDDTVEAGITIEHGQDCVIAENHFGDNNMGVELYWDPDPQFVDGAYGQARDTASRDTWLLDNVFTGNTLDVVLQQTTRVVFEGNDWDQGGQRPHVDGLTAAGTEPVEPETVLLWTADRDGALPSGRFVESSIAEWPGQGPELLESSGRVRRPTVPGHQVVRAEDRGLVVLDRSSIVIGEWGPWDHRGGEPRPEQRRPGGLLADVRWNARWFGWTEETDPRGDLDAWRALADDPLVEKTVSNWVHPWGDEDVRALIGGDHYGLIAATEVELEAGTYVLSVMSDDGVRVLVDGEEAFADWTWHAPRRGEAELELASGVHAFTVEYFQIDGAQALIVELEGRR